MEKAWRNNYFHGADIAASRGTPIKAAAGGVVILARYYGLAGRTVFIDHGEDDYFIFPYGQILVSVGQTVVTGDQKEQLVPQVVLLDHICILIG